MSHHTEKRELPRIGLSFLRHPGHFLATGFGTGIARKAPGTFGTLVGIPLFLILQPLPLWLYCLITVVLFGAGIWICEQAARDLGVHDHPGIVWDEVVGYLVTMIGIPADWLWILIGFILFRVFDILKPWPIKLIDQRVSGGFGIMLDDLIAALFSLLIMRGLLHFL